MTPFPPESTVPPESARDRRAPPPTAAAMEALRAAVEQRLLTAQAAAADAYRGATDAEARAEDKYDTRALEQSYLCAGQNARIAQLRELLTALHGFALPPGPAAVIGPGTWVEADSNGRRATYLLLPFAVGEHLDVDGVALDVVGTGTPVGRALLGKSAGDDVEVRVGSGVRVVSIVAIW